MHENNLSAAVFLQAGDLAATSLVYFWWAIINPCPGKLQLTKPLPHTHMGKIKKMGKERSWGAHKRN